MITKLQSLRVVILSAIIGLSSLGYSQTYTFTSATATGNVGPTQLLADAEYLGTTLDGAVTVTGGIQYWVVPVTGIYEIQTFGGQGYGSFGGRGAHVTGEFNLTAGTTLKILVGQEAGNYFDWPNTGYNNQYGGGGGSFVTLTDNTPLIIAGGGGGNHTTAYATTCDGQITESAADGTVGSITSTGGINGNGGNDASSADGGGGLLTSGLGIAGGQAFILGGLGGIDEGTGGFGCGGGTSSWNNVRAGGGGGYSGGGAANNNSSTCCAVGGGGGSYNSGTNPSAIAGVQTGNGIIIITNQCIPTVGTLVTDVTSLSDVSEACILTSLVAPTATNDCSSGITGVSDAVLPITTTGTTVVTWTYDDGQNIISQTQNVIITGIDTDPPVLDNPSLTSLGGQCNFTPPYPTATDICSGVITGVPDVTFPMFIQGATVITWTFTDGNGNSVTQTQNITLNDVAPPALDVATLSDINACNTSTPTAPTATDYCAGILNGVPDVTFPITTLGMTTITWSYDDGNGNTNSQTQNVYISTVDASASVTGTTIAADVAGLTYQWIDCSTSQPISGETNQSYTPTDTGDYAVEVTDNGCTDVSACFNVDYTGITELNSNMINIYPNPSVDGVFTVSCDGVVEQIIVIDALGRTLDLPVDLISYKVNGSSLVSGKYIVKVITAEGIYTKGLVIQD